jgi:hypothetical protein
MSNFKSFVREVTARLKGDEAGVVAAKNARKAESALKGQIAALEAKLVDDESTVEDRKEALQNAKFPTTPITDNQNYIQNIRRAQEGVDSAEETVADTKFSIEYFQGLLVEFDKE